MFSSSASAGGALRVSLLWLVFFRFWFQGVGVEMASGSGKNQMIYKNMQQLFLNDIWSIYETLANSRQWFTSFYYNDFSLRFFHCRFFLCVQYHLFILLLLFSEVALNTKKKRQILLLTYFCVYMVKLPGGIRSPNFCDHIKMYFIALRKKAPSAEIAVRLKRQGLETVLAFHYFSFWIWFQGVGFAIASGSGIKQTLCSNVSSVIYGVFMKY